MYTLVIESTIRAEKRAEFLKYWKTEVLLLQQKQDGFVDEILLFAKENPNRGLGLSFWESQQQAEDYYRKQFPRVVAAAQQFCESQPVIREYNVVAAETFDIPVEQAA